MKKNITRIENYQPTAEDYIETVFLADKEIAARAEIQGQLAYQEDFILIATQEVKNFKFLSHSNRKKVLEETFIQLQAQCGQEFSVGSTGCLVIGWIDDKNKLQLYTANLGDSSAFLVILTEQHLVSSERLNELHNPEPGNAEYKRLISLGQKPINYGVWRIATGLAVSRAFGDMDSEEFGLSHLADILHCQKILKKNERAMVVVACDGLADATLLDAEQIGQIIFKNQTKNPTDVCVDLVNAAFQLGSRDNISVAVFEPIATPISAVVFDGHGGDQVAKALGEHCYSVLQEVLQKIKKF